MARMNGFGAIAHSVRVGLVALVVWASGAPGPLTGQTPVSTRGAARGQTATLLADGRWLIVGGEGASPQAALRDPRTNTTVSTTNQPLDGRAWHSATVLPDGTVLIFGGRSVDGRTLSSPELFDPVSEIFQPLPTIGLTPRAHHTATLLTDGRVLITGGIAQTHVRQSEIWNVGTQTGQYAAALPGGRHDHLAILEADGRVLITGGVDVTGRPALAELYNPTLDRFIDATGQVPAAVPPYLAATIPAHGATAVSPDLRMALRFSAPVNRESITTDTVRLLGPDGPLELLRVPAELGRLLFLIPHDTFARNTTYRVEVSGLMDTNGLPVSASSVQFTTVPDDASTPDADAAAEWTPDPSGLDGWQIGRSPSSWQSVGPLRAPLGTTALAGQVLAIEDVPLANVRVVLGAVSTSTDRFGRFLLEAVEPGPGVLTVEAHAVGSPAQDYGMYEIGVDARPDVTTVVPFTVWLSRIDTARGTRLDSVATQAVTTARMPGVEVQIPAGVTLRSQHTGRLRSLTMTPLPADRPPMPLPPGVRPLALFTVQTHGALVERPNGAEAPGVRIVYPNTLGLPRGARVDFWTYETARGWIVYGQGAVSADGQRVEPDRDVRLRRVECLQFAAPAEAPGVGPRPGGGPSEGEPVDLATGLFVYQKTDVMLPDVIPVALTRTYRPNDATSRAFGIGMSHSYDMFLIGDLADTWADLILPDGGRVHFVRTSPGTGHLTAVMEHTATPTAFYKAELRWNSAVTRQSWDLTLRDGTVYEFGTKLGTNVRLVGIVNRPGERLMIERNGVKISRIISPHGRVLDFTTDASNRVTSVRDNLGREVTYGYDASGRLWRVTNAAGGVTEYTYDSAHRMLTIRDARGIVYLTNEYDASGRVNRQTQTDQTVYQFTYTVDGSGQIVQADVSNPRGFVRRVTFNSAGYWLTDTAAFGTALARASTAARQAGTQFVTAHTDPLNRRTEYAYDSKGNVLTATRLAWIPTPLLGTNKFAYWPKMSRSVFPLSQGTGMAFRSKPAASNNGLCARF